MEEQQGKFVILQSRKGFIVYIESTALGDIVKWEKKRYEVTGYTDEPCDTIRRDCFAYRTGRRCAALTELVCAGVEKPGAKCPFYKADMDE